MKKIHFVKLAIISLMMVGLLAFVPTNVQAVTGTIGSSVTLECPVEITTNGGDLAFGYLSAPSTGDACDVWVVSSAVAALGHPSGTGVDFDPADHSRGDFELTGSEPIYYSVAVTTDFGDGFLTLSDLTTDTPTGVDPSPGTTECLTVTVHVGGTLTVCPGVLPGTHSDAVITITANY